MLQSINILACLSRHASRLFLQCLGIALLTGGLVVGQPALSPQTADRPEFQPSYVQWSTACKDLPSNRTLQGRMPPKALLPIQNFRSFEWLLRQFMSAQRQLNIAKPEAWLNQAPNFQSFLDPDQSYVTNTQVAFSPFVQRVQLPPGSRVFLHGDFHGDIRSLISLLDHLNRTGILDGFKVASDNVYFCFLGDYTDRGSYGVEVIYTLMRFLLANPERVFLARGNHEDFSMTAQYGYFQEAHLKYGRDFNPVLTARIYDFLPLAIYIGCGDNYVQCCHGGMEPGFDPSLLLNAPEGKSYQLLGTLNQQAFLSSHSRILQGTTEKFQAFVKENWQDFKPLNPLTPRTIGFMWNDFSVFPDNPALDYNPGRSWIFGASATRYLLQWASRRTANLKGVIRAHQHSSLPNAMMRRLVAAHGVHRHWQSSDHSKHAEATVDALKSIVDHSRDREIPEHSVWTFNVSPDGIYGLGCDFDWDVHGWLTVAEDFSDWRLQWSTLPMMQP